jgi:hypothetical protein
MMRRVACVITWWSNSAATGWVARGLVVGVNVQPLGVVRHDLGRAKDELAMPGQCRKVNLLDIVAGLVVVAVEGAEIVLQTGHAHR